MNSSSYLGTEKVGKLLRQFAIPCIFSLIISCLYNIVDQIFVGNGIGYLGNAATGVIFPITVVGWGISLLFGDGAAAFLSVSLGKNETEEIPKSVANAIMGSFLLGLIVVLLSYAGGDSLLRLIGATDANIEMAHDYGVIIFAMMPLALVQNTMASIIRADGSPKYSMAAMLTGAVINIIGDPVAIFVLHLGIKGAAYATILGQFVSFLICILYLRRSKCFKVTKASFKPDAVLLKQIMGLGSSSFLTQFSIVVITVINNLLLVRYGALSVYGADIPLAAFVVIMKLFQIVLNIAIGIAAGAQPIVGYNYGAGKYDRVKQLLKLVIGWTAIVCLICTVLFEAVPGIFIRMFGTDSELYTQFAVLCLRIYLSLIVFTCVQKVCSIFLQSIGHARQAAPLSVLRDVFLIIFSVLLPMGLGVTGIFWGAPAADLVAIIITAFVMIKLWKELCEAEKKAQVIDESEDSLDSAAARQEMENAESVLKPSHPGIIITIAREHGSAGKRIGQMAAQMLEIPCYYKELTALAAKESGLAREFISGINTNENAVMREMYLSSNAVQQAVIAQEKVINEIADQGSCVIIGRAADHVLQGRKNLVRIFIHAPEQYRVGKVMEMYGDSREAGLENIRRSDAARAAYYSAVSGRTWGNAGNYELCIDSSIGVENTARLIADYVREAEKRAGEMK